MALPTFTSIRRPRRAPNASGSSPTPKPHGALPGSTVKAATRTRLIFALLTSLFFLVSLVFLVLVEIGNTHPAHAVLGSLYFFKLDLSHIIPASVPNELVMVVGLWNFCEGYDGQGITACSKPRTLYCFNPVQIILDELLAGATIALPANILSALKLVRIVSLWMFALFLTGACTTFVSIFLTPLSIYSRLLTLPIALFAFISALTTTVATVIATVMFVIFKNVIAGAAADINIGATLGAKMFAFMWIATSFSLVACFIQVGLCCCCASRRDVLTGRKLGRESAYIHDGQTANGGLPVIEEKPNAARRRFGFTGR